MPRKTTAHLFYSLNGVSEAPDQGQFDAFGQEEGERMGASISAVSDVVIGRKLWSEWRDYWTSSAADDPFGEFLNPIPKHVVSSTLTGELDWNSKLVDGDPIDSVNRHKEGAGGDLAVVVGLEPLRSLFLGAPIHHPT